MMYVCCKEKRECVRGSNPLYVATIAMGLLTVSKNLSPQDEWREYPKYTKACWKRWWRPYGCTIFVSETLPNDFIDVTNEVVQGYAELMNVRFNVPKEKFVENYWRG